MSKFKTYAVSILVPVAVGGIVGLLISGAMDYDMLEKPFIAPPSIVFPIVWTILYILMGVSYGLLKDNSEVDSEINVAYYGQLFINALWPIFFFVFKWRLFAFIWIVLLVIAVINMIVKFYARNKVAGLLQIPYLLWTLFATYLNIGIYLLNK